MCSEQNITCENTFAAKSKQIYAQRRFAAMSSLHIFPPPDFRWLIGPSEIDKRSLLSSDESEKANRRQQKIFQRQQTHNYLDTKGHNITTTLGCWPQELGVFARRLRVASKTPGVSDRRAIMESTAAQNKESKKRKLTMPLRMGLVINEISCMKMLFKADEAVLIT